MSEIKAKRLLILNSSNSFWGAEVSLSVLLNNLLPNEFKLILKDEGNGFSAYLKEMGISFQLSVLELSPRKLSFIKSIYFLLKTSFKNKTRFIYGNNEDLSTLLAVVRVITLFKVSTTLHIRNSPGSLDYYKKLMFLHSNIICNSEYTKRLLIRNIFLYSKSKIHLIANAHGQKKVTFDGESKSPHTLSDLQPFFLTVGMINKRKAQLDVVEVFKDAGSLIQANYVLLGKTSGLNPYLENIENFISRNGLLNKVIIWPFEKNLKPVYTAAIATIVPSINETFGRVVIESGFYGTPVIIRDIDPLKELIEHGETGLVWDGSKEHLIKLLTSLLSDREYRDYLGKNLEERVLRDFSDDKYAESVKAIILNKE